MNSRIRKAGAKLLAGLGKGKLFLGKFVKDYSMSKRMIAVINGLRRNVQFLNHGVLSAIRVDDCERQGASRRFWMIAEPAASAWRLTRHNSQHEWRRVEIGKCKMEGVALVVGWRRANFRSHISNLRSQNSTSIVVLRFLAAEFSGPA